MMFITPVVILSLCEDFSSSSGSQASDVSGTRPDSFTAELVPCSPHSSFTSDGIILVSTITIVVFVRYCVTEEKKKKKATKREKERRSVMVRKNKKYTYGKAYTHTTTIIRRGE